MYFSTVSEVAEKEKCRQLNEKMGRPQVTSIFFFFSPPGVNKKKNIYIFRHVSPSLLSLHAVISVIIGCSFKGQSGGASS